MSSIAFPLASRPHSARLRRQLLATAAILLAIAPAVAHADTAADADTDQAGDAIIVTGLRENQAGTGTKTDTPLMETAQSITVIDNDELTRRNALSINQALGYVAGVANNQRGAMVTRYDQVVVRGFTPALFLDGMRLIAGPYSTPQIDFNRVDHIDILKGPASVLYGNAGPGGLVNLTSKMPQAGAFGRFEAQIGNYDSFRLVGDVNTPLDSQGRFLARIVGGWQKADGLTNFTTAERYHVSPMLTFAPDPATSLTIIATYQHAPSGGGYSGVPAYGTVIDIGLPSLPRDINTGDPNYERYNHKARSVAAFFRRDLSDALTFRSSARYQNNTLSYRQMYVAGFVTQGGNSNYDIITRGGGGADEDFDTLTLDNSLNAKFATGPIEHNILAGIDYQNIRGENVQQFNTGQTANPLTSFPNTVLRPFPVYGSTVPSFDLTALSAAYTNSFSKRDQVGIYVQDQMAIGRLKLIASGRKDWYHQSTLNKRNNSVALLEQAAFTMRLGALYEFDFGLSPYVSYAESFEPQAGTDYLGAPFDPVTGRQYEAGLKFQPPGTRAIFTLSAYDLRRQKVPTGDPRAGTGGIPTNAQIQIGEVRVRGIEFEGRGEVTPGFDVVAAASYTDAIITQGTPAILPTATNSGTPTTTGTRQLGVPKWGGSAFLSYDFGKAGAAGAIGGLILGAGVRHVGASDGTTTYAVINGVTTFRRFTTDSFTLVDALIGYDLAKAGLAGWSVAVNAANLFDTTHISACPFNNSCYYGAPRTVMGSLRFAW
jgi:iron complex outermembrane receptor protein